MIAKLTIMIALWGFTCCEIAQGQTAPTTTLQIEFENYVGYIYDVFDPSKVGTDSNATIPNLARNFRIVMAIGDIVAVNGRPAKGTLTERRTSFFLSPNPAPGQAIADTTRNTLVDRYYEIMQADGTPVGTIMISGLGGGDSPPGAPLVPDGAQGQQQNVTITGGTGAFLGLRGQEGVLATPVPTRSASVTEDPANRRILKGGRIQVIFNLIPLFRPEIMAVMHADFSPVTAASPALAGEVLILRATGLGPLRAGIDPRQPFPPQEVNSPVDATVNGKPAEVINKIGWPGTTETYRVDIKVPDGLAAGIASIQLSAAWIAGATIGVPLR
jgi:hypothetical protein